MPKCSFIPRLFDEHFCELRDRIVGEIRAHGLDPDLFYWPNVTAHRLEELQDTSDIVVIFHIDHIMDLDHIKHSLASRDQRFVIFSTQLTESWAPNVEVFWWGSDILCQRDGFRTLEPVIHKQWDQPHWISLSLNSRMHRVMAGAWITGRRADRYGDLRISAYPAHDAQDWKQYCDWDHSASQDSILRLGFARLKNNQYRPPDLQDVYVHQAGDNVDNFNRNLRMSYQSKAVEIVNETCFLEPGLFLTEKFLQSVFALNLPIIIGQPGIVSLARRLGFDLFDDVIDHGYDLETDPLRRICRAIDGNLPLLINRDRAIDCWHHCHDRLQNNFHYARQSLHDDLARRAMDSIPAAVKFLS